MEPAGPIGGFPTLFSFEYGTALSTDDGTGPWICNSGLWVNHRAFLLQQCLCPVKQFPVNNSGMAARYEILVILTLISLLPVGQCSGGIGLLCQRVTRIFLIVEDILDRRCLPVWGLISCGDPVPRDLFCDVLHAASIEVSLEDQADNLGLCLDNLQPSFDQAVSKRGLAGDEAALFHFLLVGPADIFRDSFTLFLGYHGEDGCQQLAGHLGGIDALLLKADPDPQVPQLPDRHQALTGVSREPCGGFRQDLVDAASAAVLQEPLEVIPLLRGGPGDPLIRIYVHKLPFRVAGDEFCVVGILRGKGVDLVLRVGTDAGVSGHTQFPGPDRPGGRDHDNMGGAVQCEGSTDRCLFVHLNHLCSATHNTLTFSEKLYSNATTIEADI